MVVIPAAAQRRAGIYYVMHRFQLCGAFLAGMTKKLGELQLPLWYKTSLNLPGLQGVKNATENESC